MNSAKIFIILFLTSYFICFAQQKNDNFIYATLESNHANELKLKFPKQIEIIESKNNLAAVYFDMNLVEELHQKILSHGPGYIFHPNLQLAKNALTVNHFQPKIALNYTISEQEYVNKILNDVEEKEIENIILKLENFKTRHHLSVESNLAAEDLKNTWENLIKKAGRENDISVKLVSHVNTPMKSVVLTIKGNNLASEYVIIGGHLDSIITHSDQSFAPGADDNASGIATITEILRVLLNNNFYPERTVEIMAYAAEEIGLVGSNEIAIDYKNKNIDIYGYLQFDMTGFKGSVDDIYITTDTFNNNNLNLFLFQLMEEYNKKGNHQFTYNTTRCNYGCSDHYSWATKGYAAAFPFEASFDETSPFIHTIDDTYKNMNFSTAHAAKFVKLGLEFVVEMSKLKKSLNTIDHPMQNLNKFYTNGKSLGFEIDRIYKIESALILNTSGQKVFSKFNLNKKDKVNLTHLPTGAYILILETDLGEKITHKFLLN